MKTCALLLAALAAFSVTARANSGVAWGNNFIDNLQMYDNEGNLLDSNFTFDLGTFGSFVPTLANIDSWQANWKLLSHGDTYFDFTTTPSQPIQNFGQDLDFNLDGTVQNLPNSATFAGNEQAYLWVRGNNEWALVTDNSPGPNADDIWKLPPTTTTEGTKLTFVLNNADTPIIGGVNGIQSGTPHSYDPGTAFRLQTAVVPEPGASLLVLLAGCVVRFVRSRSKTT